MEFANANSNSAFEFIQKLYEVKSPSAFVELSTEHYRKQIEALTEQEQRTRGTRPEGGICDSSTDKDRNRQGVAPHQLSSCHQI